jgi:hypothetical protein
LDRLHADWNRAHVVWGLSATLAGMVGLRHPCRWNRPGPASADYRASRTLASGKPISPHPYIDSRKASTVMGPAARLPNRQAVHHAGFDCSRTGRRFQAVSRSARTSHGPKSQKTFCSHASRRAASWGTEPLTHTSRSAFRADTEASPEDAGKAGKQGDAASHAAGAPLLLIPAPRGQPAFS